MVETEKRDPIEEKLPYLTTILCPRAFPVQHFLIKSDGHSYLICTMCDFGMTTEELRVASEACKDRRPLCGSCGAHVDRVTKVGIRVFKCFTCKEDQRRKYARPDDFDTDRNCEECGDPVRGNRRKRRARYCDPSCNKSAYRRRRLLRETTPTP